MLMLLFYIGDDIYAIDCQYVVEVLPQLNLKKMSHYPPFVLGLANVRNKPFIIVDGGLILGDNLSPSFFHTRIILLSQNVTNQEEFCLGLLAEKVIELVEIPLENFTNLETKRLNFPYLEKITQLPTKTIQLINIPQFFQEMKEKLKNI